MTDSESKTDSACDLRPPAYEGVEIVNLQPAPSPVDYQARLVRNAG